MRRCRATEHQNSQALWMLLPLLGERAGVRASVSFNLIFGVGGGFRREKHFRLVTSAATALAVILELTLGLTGYQKIRLAKSASFADFIWCVLKNHVHRHLHRHRHAVEGRQSG